MITLEFASDKKLKSTRYLQENKFPTIRKADFSPLFKQGLKILEREGKLKSLQRIFQKSKRDLTIQCTLTDDQNIEALNADYRGLKKPTDVLSFSYYQYYQARNSDSILPLGADTLIGEIIISLDTARRQAQEHQKTLKQEVQFLFVHGLLHLFDYDHEEPADRKIMFDLQDEVLGTRMWRALIDEES